MSTRRQFLRRGVTGLGLAGVLGGCSQPIATPSRKGPAPARPNIVLVTVDTLGRGHLGCYGYGKDTSPNFDRFAEESLFFADSYSSGNETLPCMASLFSGLYPHHHGTLCQQPVQKKVPTLAKLLSKHGYRTAAFTSTFFLNRHTTGGGFDDFDHPTQGERLAQESVALAEKYVLRASQEQKPFFLWLHLWDVHGPYLPPGAFREKFLERSDVACLERMQGLVTPFFTHAYPPLDGQWTEEEQRVIRSQYDGEIAYTDAHLGHFVDVLKATGVYDRSVVVMTADHGESLFENGDDWFTHIFIYEPVVRIPLMIRHPDFSPRRIEGLVQNIDVAPTLLTWAGIAPGAMDGHDLTPLVAHNTSLRSVAYLTESGNRVFGVTDGYHKVRCLGDFSPVHCPPPEQWRRDLDLPRLEITAGASPEESFKAAGGRLRNEWRCPPEIRGQISGYTYERMGELIFGDDGVRRLRGSFVTSTVDGGVFDRGYWPQRNWNREAAFSPWPYRITAQDAAGKTIAASVVLTKKLDSPLGTQERYNLSSDLLEQHNLAGTPSPEFEALEQQVLAFAAESTNALKRRGDSTRLSDEDAEGLRNMGYL